MVRDDIWENQDKSIWRYLDFYQLVSIIEREKLYFSPISEFQDHYEGSFPVADSIDGTFEDDEIVRFRQRFPRCVFANCWHINSREAASMWNQYDDRGIVIKSTVQNLRDSITESKRGVHLFKVRYIDYDEDELSDHRLAAYFHKRKSFEHEREFRLLFIDYPPQKGAEDSDFPDEFEGPFDYITSKKEIPDEKFVSGQYHNIELDNLIQEIRINPNRGDDFEDLVSNLVKRYNLDIEVKQSDLSSDPVY